MRLFLALDLDAFYCGVEEHDDPTLVGQPFCVFQKQIVATLSYPARALGLRKLMAVDEVRRLYPEMRLIDGESLSKYRAAGKALLTWLRRVLQCSVERLGLEEMRVELTSIVDFNLQTQPLASVLKRNGALSDEEVGQGLVLDLNTDRGVVECPDFFFHFDGATFPPGYEQFDTVAAAQLWEPYIAGHLACYVRDRMRLEMGYQCSVGVASTKTYAKIVGTLGKPGGVAVLMPGHEAEFLATRPLKSVPGFGMATRRQICANLGLEQEVASQITGRTLLDSAGPDAPASLGLKQELWDLIRGCELPSDIVDFTVPTQVSIEDTYGKPPPSQQLGRELQRLVDSLLVQVRTDLVDETTSRWLGTPHHIVVTVANHGSGRRSKSAKIALPKGDTTDQELMSLGSLLDRSGKRLLRELTAESGDSIRLINICLKIDPAVDVLDTLAGAIEHSGP